jgi:hypothetical protein
MQEVKNILRIFKETKKAIEKKDTYKLKLLSDQTNNTASRTNDLDNIAIAVIIYSIEKILEREKYKNSPRWNNFYNKLKFHINQSIIYLKNNNEEKFSNCLKEIRKEMENFSGKLKNYIEDIFRKAKINKASKIYEHGISMERTANLLGVTLWELANYIGEKEIIEINDKKDFSVKSRIKLAMEMFE